MKPSNLHLLPSIKTRFVEADVYDIANRLAHEVSPRLHVWQMEDGDKQKCKWYVMEACDDGVERFVCKTDDLDSRLVEYCQRLIRIPFYVRVQAAELASEEMDRQDHEDEMDKLYENVGRRMWWQLWHDGFVEQRGVSYPTKGIHPTR